jgi:hypothetical protein
VLVAVAAKERCCAHRRSSLRACWLAPVGSVRSVPTRGRLAKS